MRKVMEQESIAAAGNTVIPAYLTLVKLGFAVDRINDKNDNELWIATKGALRLVGDCPVELLGLCLLRSERGAHWQATDDQIDHFMKQFYPAIPSK
jgi:hypothetical protein